VTNKRGLLPGATIPYFVLRRTNEMPRRGRASGDESMTATGAVLKTSLAPFQKSSNPDRLAQPQRTLPTLRAQALLLQFSGSIRHFALLPVPVLGTVHHYLSTQTHLNSQLIINLVFLPSFSPHLSALSPSLTALADPISRTGRWFSDRRFCLPGTASSFLLNSLFATSKRSVAALYWGLWSLFEAFENAPARSRTTPIYPLADRGALHILDTVIFI
jgi:hypothetical protein